MSDAARAYDDIARAAAERGLLARGGFHPTPADGVPPLASGAAAASLVLLGMTAAVGWSGFSSASEFEQVADPLDRYSRRVIGELAGALGGDALFPFAGPPWLPFQRWASRAEPVAPTPLGVLIHAEHGVWHGYRGALAFEDALSGVPERAPWRSPCLDCADTPCLSACPVDAFDATGFAPDACAGHLAASAEPCLDAGCLARAACPVAPQARYGQAQRRFHMRSFKRSLLGTRKVR